MLKFMLSNEPSNNFWAPLCACLIFFTRCDLLHMRIYINVAYSVTFCFPASSIVWLGLGLVVGLGSVLVLFFIAFLLCDVCLKTEN